MFWISILCMGNLHTAHLWKQGPLVTFELQAVNNKPFHWLGWGTIQLTEVWRQVTTSNHKDYLRKKTERRQLLKAGNVRQPSYICGGSICWSLRETLWPTKNDFCSVLVFVMTSDADSHGFHKMNHDGFCVAQNNNTTNNTNKGMLMGIKWCWDLIASCSSCS